MYKRTLIMYRREPVLSKARLAQTVVVGVIVGLIFFQLGNSQVRMLGAAAAATAASRRKEAD